MLFKRTQVYFWKTLRFNKKYLFGSIFRSFFDPSEFCWGFPSIIWKSTSWIPGTGSAKLILAGRWHSCRSHLFSFVQLGEGPIASASSITSKITFSGLKIIGETWRRFQVRRSRYFRQPRYSGCRWIGLKRVFTPTSVISLRDKSSNSTLTLRESISRTPPWSDMPWSGSEISVKLSKIGANSSD